MPLKKSYSESIGAGKVCVVSLANTIKHMLICHLEVIMATIT